MSLLLIILLAYVAYRLVKAGYVSITLPPATGALGGTKPSLGSKVWAFLTTVF